MPADLPHDRIPPELAIEVEPFTLDALDAYQDDASPADRPEVVGVSGWTIGNDDDAEWAMAHVAAIDAGVNLANDQKKARVERITRWHAGTVKRLSTRRSFFAAHLEGYATDFRARDPKRNKTLSLPSGVVKSHETQPTVGVANDAVLAEWARENLTAEQVAAIVTESIGVMQLRKVSTIMRRPLGYIATLDCGHEAMVPAVGPTGTPHTPNQLMADGMPCDQCDPDPIDGWPHRTVVKVDDWDEPVVVAKIGDTTVDVPGAKVQPGGVTYSVKPS